VGRELALAWLVAAPFHGAHDSHMMLEKQELFIDVMISCPGFGEGTIFYWKK